MFQDKQFKGSLKLPLLHFLFIYIILNKFQSSLIIKMSIFARTFVRSFCIMFFVQEKTAKIYYQLEHEALEYTITII